MREKLKAPLGLLIPDAMVSKKLLAPYFSSNNITVSVGDRTAERLHEFGFVPFLQIIDFFEKRIRLRSSLLSGGKDNLLRAANPAGSISVDAMQKLRESLDLVQIGRKNLLLEISGEEDLLALPVIAFFPGGTVTFYGQPDEGMIIVSTAESTKKSRRLLSEIGILSLG